MVGEVQSPTMGLGNEMKAGIFTDDSFYKENQGACPCTASPGVLPLYRQLLHSNLDANQNIRMLQAAKHAIALHRIHTKNTAERSSSVPEYSDQAR